MPNDFDILSNNIKVIIKDIDFYIAKEAVNYKEELADLNVSQMEKGIGGDGKKIKPEYSNKYAQFKGFKTPNLKVTGDYHSSIYVEQKNDRMLFDSNDTDTDKRIFLDNHYNNSQYGVAPQNEQEAADYIDSDNFIKTIDYDITQNVV